ncbi:MAG: hypothetical protein JW395_0817 [Nitrospira sp.]|nr:hypothetical protein [Nitrospira sp.]
MVRAFRVEHHVGVEPGREACFGQEALCLVRVVWQDLLDLSLGEVVGKDIGEHQCPLTFAAGGHLDDLVAVNGVGDCLAYLHIIEGRALVVEVQALGSRRVLVLHQAWDRALRFIQQARVATNTQVVDLLGDQGRLASVGVFDDDCIYGIHIGLAFLEVRRVLLHDVLGAALAFRGDQLEGAGANDGLLEILVLLVDLLGVDHVVGCGGVVEERRKALLEFHHNGVWVGGGDAVHALEEEGELPCRELVIGDCSGAGHVFKAPLHVSGGELTTVDRRQVGVLHALPKTEGVRSGVGADFPAFGEHGFYDLLAVRDAVAHLEVQKRVIGRLDHERVGVGRPAIAHVVVEGVVVFGRIQRPARLGLRRTATGGGGLCLPASKCAQGNH